MKRRAFISKIAGVLTWMFSGCSPFVFGKSHAPLRWKFKENDLGSNRSAGKFIADFRYALRHGIPEENEFLVAFFKQSKSRYQSGFREWSQKMDLL